MKENRKNEQAKKDYYSPVLLSQIFCCVLLLAIFFLFKSSSQWQLLREDYTFLLREDFLSQEIEESVSAVREYLLSDEADMAVVGSRVESYVQKEDNKQETTVAQQVTEETKPVFSSAELSDIGLSYKNSAEAESLSLKKTKGMIFPVYEGRYTSYFGERTDPISEGSDFHRGVDIGADEGDRIRAVYDGTVSEVGYDSRSGNYIFLTHPNGYVTFYCHCSEVLAKEGAVIRQGETIALVGSTGYSTGPHLHFEVRVEGESIDPLPLIDNAV